MKELVGSSNNRNDKQGDNDGFQQVGTFDFDEGDDNDEIINIKFPFQKENQNDEEIDDQMKPLASEDDEEQLNHTAHDDHL